MNIEILPTKTEYKTMKIDGYFIHSSYNPIREAEKFAKSNYVAGKTHILYGYGLGYFALELLKHFQHKEKLIIIEPFLAIEEKRSDILYIDKNDIENVQLLLAKYIDITEPAVLLKSPNYDKIDQDKYLDIAKFVKNQVISNKVARNTINHFANQWFENIVHNLYFATKDYSIKELKDKYDCPIVIASGGPSLTKQLKYIKQYRDKMLLIAAGSTINSLLAANIVPDLVVSIDGGQPNLNHFKDLYTDEIMFMYGLTSKYEIREHFKAPSFFFGSEGEGVNSELAQVIKDPLVIVSGGSSVAVFCLTIASYITTGKIALIGQDLAYTNNQSHASNNKGAKILSKEEIEKRKIEIEGYYGEKVYSDAPFITMKNDFELTMSILLKDREVFNCTEGGAKIEGMHQLSFKEFCETNCCHKVPLIDLPFKKNTQSIAYLDYWENQLPLFDQTIKLLEDSLLVLKRDQYKQFFESKTIKQLDKNEELIEENISNLNLSRIMEKANLAVLTEFPAAADETKEQEFKRVYNQNEFLYTEFIDTLKVSKDIIQKFLKQYQTKDGILNGKDSI
ncbi:motility associated factor glycosyltransferase family protein [Rummeliibacillus pycnus]|uniref:motility associated factor glycosyltransferase family protein n=1 Tax=Rummeliibacillus pycnus TaxID=101070 RepID=UPI000C9BADD2|nr:6-hydroxymethylpterin diphosphokinase MptE-like protein [Rummeliibacillus pycnus]